MVVVGGYCHISIYIWHMWSSAPTCVWGYRVGRGSRTPAPYFFLFLALKVSLSVPKRTPES